MDRTTRTIVAGIAEVQERDAVLAAAVQLALQTGATLHLVHAFELPDPLLSAYARDGYLGAQFGAGQRQALEEQMRAQVRSLTDRERIECHAVNGPTGEILCEEAESYAADLLLVGATRSGRLLRTILGSTAERVIRGSSVPVLVLRRPLEKPAPRVLFTTDLSEFSAAVHERGLSVIRELFPASEPQIRSLLVVWYDLAFPPPLRRDSLEDVAVQELREFLAKRSSSVAVDARVRIGDPSKEIAAEAVDWDADLLVLGTQSRSAPSRFLLGSVAEATVRAAATNVLIVPPRAVGPHATTAEPVRSRAET